MRSKVTRYRSIRIGYCAPPGTHCPASPRCIFPPYVCPTCTRHLNTRARIPLPLAVSSSFPIMCKLYYFYPKYISPPCAAPRPPGSTGQIAHVHRKSPPGHGQYPSGAAAPLPSTWVFPSFQKSRIFALGVQRLVILYDLRIMQKVGVDEHDFVTAQFLKREKN